MTSVYWAMGTRECQSRDLGHKCKECKCKFTILGEVLAIRRGGRIELRYHQRCFTGDADPRTQTNSSYNSGVHVLLQKAPEGKFRKMRTASHF